MNSWNAWLRIVGTDGTVLFDSWHRYVGNEKEWGLIGNDKGMTLNELFARALSVLLDNEGALLDGCLCDEFADWRKNG